MSRYVFTCTVGKSCVLYDESTPEEDKMDVLKDGTVLQFGSGYLSFWERCKKKLEDYRRIERALVDNSLADTFKGMFPEGDLVAVIEDLYYGEGKDL